MDKVEANNHVRQFRSCKVCINLPADMVLSLAFLRTNDDLHCEERRELSNFELNFLKDRQLLLQGERTILVKDKACGMPPFDNCDCLLGHRLDCAIENHLEESGVIVKLYKEEDE